LVKYRASMTNPTIRPVTISPQRDENPPSILGSLVALRSTWSIYAAIAIHTMLCRRKYGKFIDEKELVDLSLPVQFFMLTPGRSTRRASCSRSSG
jgi:hypothetical protein